MTRQKLMIAVGGLGIILMLLLILRPKQADRPTRSERAEVAEPEDDRRAKARVGKWTASADRPQSSKNSADKGTTRTTDAKTSGTPLVGYYVDDFRGWSRIPDGYFADGVAATNGGITLSDARNTSEPISGVIQSPSLPLWQPSYSAPAISQVELPEGATVNAEISLSRDGKAWGPWMLAGRYSKPDGTQAVPIEQPRWNGIRRSEPAASTKEEMTTGPRIRYRMTLTGTSGQYPVIRDFRVWHNTMAFPGDR